MGRACLSFAHAPFVHVRPVYRPVYIVLRHLNLNYLTGLVRRIGVFIIIKKRKPTCLKCLIVHNLSVDISGLSPGESHVFIL